jgi:hypothetical protein
MMGVVLCAAAAAGARAAAPKLPPAPSGFTASLASVYSTLYQTAHTIDGKTGTTYGQRLVLPSVFDRRIAKLSAKQLAVLYAATRRTVNWDQVAPGARRLLAVARSYRLRRQVRGIARRSSHRRRHHRSARPHGRRLRRLGSSGPKAMVADAAPAPFPPAEPTGDFPAPPPAFEAEEPVGPIQLMSCASGLDPLAYETALDTAIFTASVVSATAEAAGEVIPALEVALGEGVVDPAKYAAYAIWFAAATVQDGLEAAREIQGDCVAFNLADQATNTENSQVQTYNLQQQNAQTLANTENSVNTVHDQVHIVQQSLDDELTVEIQQALALPVGAPADVYYELPATVGGNLDSTPIGVKAIVTNAYNGAKQAGLAVNANATTYLNAANSALTAKNYRTAWKDFQLAYQAMG